MKLHSPDVLVTDSNEALTYLKEGNARFVSGNTAPRDPKAGVAATSGGQKPFAAIITCADSRTSPELYFDQQIGDIFVLRNAGNVADKSVLGSLEFAVEHLKVSLIVVVGHTKCGAVNTSYSGATGLAENLQAVLDGIRPNLAGAANEDEATVANAKKQAEVIGQNAVVKQFNIPVHAAKYCLDTGAVTFV